MIMCAKRVAPDWNQIPDQKIPARSREWLRRQLADRYDAEALKELSISAKSERVRNTAAEIVEKSESFRLGMVITALRRQYAQTSATDLKMIFAPNFNTMSAIEKHAHYQLWIEKVREELAVMTTDELQAIRAQNYQSWPQQMVDEILAGRPAATCLDANEEWRDDK